MLADLPVGEPVVASRDDIHLTGPVLKIAFHELLHDK
jgi:hypothetical protein